MRRFLVLLAFVMGGCLRDQVPRQTTLPEPEMRVLHDVTVGSCTLHPALPLGSSTGIVSVAHGPLATTATVTYIDKEFHRRREPISLETTAPQWMLFPKFEGAFIEAFTLPQLDLLAEFNVDCAKRSSGAAGFAMISGPNKGDERYFLICTAPSEEESFIDILAPPSGPEMIRVYGDPKIGGHYLFSPMGDDMVAVVDLLSLTVKATLPAEHFNDYTMMTGTGFAHLWKSELGVIYSQLIDCK